MKKVPKIAVAVLLSIASPFALAQAPGWNIAWGPQAVPLSPALTGLMALALAVAAYAFLRKRATHGAVSLLVAGLVGGMGMQEDLLANGYDYTIAASQGTQFVSCSGGSLDIGTSVNAGVRISQVTPNFSDESLTNSISTQCAPGVLVTPSQSCQLPCPLIPG
ncbi:MAG: hypothetical protein ACOZB0_04215 [Pseudomonadota bacterium]